MLPKELAEKLAAEQAEHGSRLAELEAFAATHAEVLRGTINQMAEAFKRLGEALLKFFSEGSTGRVCRVVRAMGMVGDWQGEVDAALRALRPEDLSLLQAVTRKCGQKWRPERVDVLVQRMMELQAAQPDAGGQKPGGQ